MEESNQNASEAQTMKMESKEKSQDMNSLSGYEKDLTESLCIDVIIHISFKKTRLPFIGNSSFLKKWEVTSSWPRPTALIIFVRTEASWRISTDFSFPQQRAQLAL